MNVTSCLMPMNCSVTGFQRLNMEANISTQLPLTSHDPPMRLALLRGSPGGFLLPIHEATEE